jgi:hypothetical protein
MDVYRAVSTVLRVPHGRAGAMLVALCWPLNWLLPGLRSAYLFFPLWLGYILIVDALVLSRGGVSLFTRSRRNFAGLFLTSAPAWWLFELINRRTHNWEYLGGERFSRFEYFVFSTISFSTVMPAVFETAELVRTFRWMDRFTSRRRIQPTGGVYTAMLSVGLVMLAITLAWPERFYPGVWGSVFLILEPVNVWLGRRHLLEGVQVGDWRALAALSTGALICGFFWEMWNFYSYPKWIYHTPGVEFWHLFEMPLLGYGGYIFFAWELYALKNFLQPAAPPLRI